MQKIKTILALSIFSIFFLSVNLFAGGSDPESGFRVFPTLEVVTTNSVGIMWESFNSDSSTIKISLNQNLSGARVLHTSSAKLHKVNVQGLTAATKYYYNISTDGETSSVKSFVTSLEKGERLPFRFIVYGDSRKSPWYEDIVSKYGDNDDHLPVIESMNQYSPDFAVHVGDYVFSGTDMDAIYNFFDVEKSFLGNTPLLPVYGNHEFDGGDTESNTYMDSYLIPAEGENFAYYSYNYGNVHILVLNTGHGVWANDNYDLLKPGSAQYAFLKNDLENAAIDSDIDHIFVAMHVPLYSVANFGDNDTLRNSLEPLFMQNGVEIVFTGHEHDYQHQTANGIHYVLTGGCGSPIMDYPWKGDENDSDAHLVKYDNVLNYVIVDVNGSNVNVQARKVQGNGNSSSSVIDTFSL